jgi:hypothetical protein
MAYDYDDDEVFDTGRGGSVYPTAKLREKGQQVVGLVVDYDDKAALWEYGVTPPVRALTPDGREKTKDILTLLLVEGTDCVVVMPRKPGETESREETATPGMIVRAHIQGHNRWTKERPTSWMNARDAYGSLHTCAVVTGRFDSTTRTGFNGVQLSQDKKIHVFSVRRPDAAEERYVDACRAEHRALKENMANSTAGAMNQSSGDELF